MKSNPAKEAAGRFPSSASQINGSFMIHHPAPTTPGWTKFTGEAAAGVTETEGEEGETITSKSTGGMSKPMCY